MENENDDKPTETQRGIPAGAMLNKEENEMLEWLIEQHGSDRAKMIRWLIKQRYEEEQRTQHGRDTFRKALKGQRQARPQAR